MNPLKLVKMDEGLTGTLVVIAALCECMHWGVWGGCLTPVVGFTPG